MGKIILIVSLLFILTGCGLASGGCYWDEGRRKDKLYCYEYGSWKVKQIVEKSHKRHKHKDRRH